MKPITEILFDEKFVYEKVQKNWHPVLNGSLTPTDFPKNSKKDVFFFATNVTTHFLTKSIDLEEVGVSFVQNVIGNIVGIHHVNFVLTKVLHQGVRANFGIMKKTTIIHYLY